MQGYRQTGFLNSITEKTNIILAEIFRRKKGSFSPDLQILQGKLPCQPDYSAKISAINKKKGTFRRMSLGGDQRITSMDQCAIPPKEYSKFPLGPAVLILTLT